jgi:hypothetical protein
MEVSKQEFTSNMKRTTPMSPTGTEKNGGSELAKVYITSYLRFLPSLEKQTAYLGFRFWLHLISDLLHKQ